jgi:hypothetical protein
VLVTNLTHPENPHHARDRRDPGGAEPPEAGPAAELEVDPGEADRKAEERSRPRGTPPRRTAAVLPEGNVKLAPVGRPEPPRATPASGGKQDSFEGGVPDDDGPLTPDDVRKTYAANEVGLKRCYERALKSDPTTSVSKMVVKITIGPEGGVSEIQVPDRPSDLSGCVKNSIKSWRFRRSTGEFTTEFTVFFAKRG